MITSKVETIGPEKAKEYLKANINNPRGNHSLSRSVVKRYAEDMKAGKWELNGEAIEFDEDGVLKNGQHRLAAIIVAGVEVKILVVRGVSRDTIVYDIPLKRNAAQMVNAMGFDCNPTITAAAGIIVNKFTKRESPVVIRDYAAKNFDELNRAYRVCCYGNNKYSRNAACIAATYLVLRTKAIPVYEAELFFRLFNDYGYTSADGYEAGPAMVARQMFEDRDRQNGYQIQKERLEIIIMALNDFHKNKKRENKYRLGEPFQFMELLKKVRREDGLED